MEKTLEKAVEEGAKKIIIIDDENSGPSKSAYFWKTYSLFVNKGLSKAVVEYSNKKHIQKEIVGVDVIYISPTKKLSISALDNKKKHLEEAFNLGYEDTRDNAELKRFLK